MSHLLSALDRFIVFLAGLALLASGAWALTWLFEVHQAREFARYYDPQVYRDFLASQWYPVALVGTAAVALLAGLSLLHANLRRRRFGRLAAAATPAAGDISVSTARLAKAVGDSLCRVPGVESAPSVPVIDRGRRVLQWVITAQPDVDMPGLTSAIDEDREDLSAALPGVDLHTRFLVHLRPVDGA